MKRFIHLTVFLTLFLTGSVAVRSQSPCDGVQMPAGTLCISQAAGNVAAENKRELDATKQKVIVLESALADKDKLIAEIKAVGVKNQADLTAALHKTEVELATKTGQLIGAEAANVRSLAIIDVLLKGQKKKCMPFSVCLF